MSRGTRCECGQGLAYNSPDGLCAAHTDLARFWSRVDRSTPSGCWEWTGETNSNGYGRFASWRGGVRRRHLAHRVSLSWSVGRLLDPSELVLHACDNPLCVNPRHLSVGTQVDNMQDAKAKGRMNLSGLALGLPARLAAKGAAS